MNSQNLLEKKNCEFNILFPTKVRKLHADSNGKNCISKISKGKMALKILILILKINFIRKNSHSSKKLHEQNVFLFCDLHTCIKFQQHRNCNKKSFGYSFVHSLNTIKIKQYCKMFLSLQSKKTTRTKMIY